MGSKGQGEAPQRWSAILPWYALVLGLTGGAGAAPKRALACL